MACRCDSSGPVDIDSDISLLGNVRRACVDAEANADRSLSQSCLRLSRRLQRTRRRREGNEEGVSLRVDFDAAVGGESLADHASMLAERLRVTLRTELMQELRRAFDVSEDERHRSGRQIAPHKRNDAPQRSPSEAGRRPLGARSGAHHPETPRSSALPLLAYRRSCVTQYSTSGPGGVEKRALTA